MILKDKLYILSTVVGSCQQETTISELYGTHLWKMTSAALNATANCEYGAPFGTGSATAYRLCLPGGRWSEPDYSKCRDGKV